MVARGAQINVSDIQLNTCVLNKFARDAEKFHSTYLMMVPIPVRAMVSLIPPSSSFGEFHSNKRANKVKTINMMIGATR